MIERIKDDHGGHALKVHQDATTGRGSPDIDACVRGRCVKVELKMPGKTPTPAQYGRMRRWENAGALVGWIRSLEELDELLSHAGDLEWRNPQLAPGVGSTGPVAVLGERIELGA